MDAKKDFLNKHVFFDLTNLNNGFDSESIEYFSEKDFEIVLNRIQELGLGIYGIEPWKDGEFYHVEVHEDYSKDPTDSNWYFNSFKRFKETGETLQYAASYFIPEELLK